MNRLAESNLWPGASPCLSPDMGAEALARLNVRLHSERQIDQNPPIARRLRLAGRRRFRLTTRSASLPATAGWKQQSGRVRPRSHHFRFGYLKPRRPPGAIKTSETHAHFREIQNFVNPLLIWAAIYFGSRRQTARVRARQLAEHSRLPFREPDGRAADLRLRVEVGVPAGPSVNCLQARRRWSGRPHALAVARSHA